MSRAIVYRGSEDRAGTRGAAVHSQPDGYSEKLVKLIPAEVVTVYLALVNVAQADEGLPALVPWLVFAFGLVATWLYSQFTLMIKDARQLIVTIGAFSVWAVAIGGPFQELAWYRDTYSALILPMYTFLAPYITNK